MDDFNSSLGTIGGGNHFAELMCISENKSKNNDLLDENYCYLAVHSGSRDYGDSIHSEFKHHECMIPNTPECKDFLTKHDDAVNWAKANRHAIALKFCKASGLKIDVKTYELTHNFIESNYDEMIYIHRKGTIPSKIGPALIPGSRGSYSYLVDGEKSNIKSLPHGAGRKLSRHEAKEYFQHNNPKHMTKTSMDSYVISRNESLLKTEHPDCYKDLSTIIEYLESEYDVNILSVFQPLTTLKW